MKWQFIIGTPVGLVGLSLIVAIVLIAPYVAKAVRPGKSTTVGFALILPLIALLSAVVLAFRFSNPLPLMRALDNIDGNAVRSAPTEDQKDLALAAAAETLQLATALTLSLIDTIQWLGWIAAVCTVYLSALAVCMWYAPSRPPPAPE